jgi:hypothetical protein
MGFREVHLKYDHTFPIMQLIEQLVNRELVVYHEEEWQIVQYSPNTVIVHQTIINIVCSLVTGKQYFIICLHVCEVYYLVMFVRLFV